METQATKQYEIGDTVTVASGSLRLKIKVTGTRTAKYGFPVVEGFINGDTTAPVWAYETQIISVTPAKQ